MKHFTFILFLVLFCPISTLIAQTGEALHFDGTNDQVSAGNVAATNFGTSDFTIEFWVNTTYSSATGAGTIISKRPQCNCDNFWNIKLKPAGQLYYESSQTISCANGKELVASTINDGQWHHVAVTRSGTTVIVYIDGVQVAIDTSFPLANLSNTAPLTFGGDVCSPFSWGGYLIGSMDEVRIWNSALSAAQVLAGYNSELTGNEAGLILYYNMNQGIANGNNPTETTVTDASPNGNNGTLSNFALNGTSSNWVGQSPVASPAVVSPPQVPTLSEWGLIILALLLLTFGTLQLIQQARTEEMA